MKKILSSLLGLLIISLAIIPTVEAATRTRRGGYGITYNRPQAPVSYNTTGYSSYQTYQAPQNQNSGYTYYFSPTYISGYTYYSSPTPGYYYYGTIPAQNTSSIQLGRYYFSSSYVSGYTYYSSPTPGYYYYLGTTPVNSTNYNPYYNNNPNAICTIVDGIYRCTNNVYVPTYSVYPGCSNADIIIGGQMWASCNAIDINNGSTSKSGWFFAGDSQASFASYNGLGNALEWLGKQTRNTDWNIGPCASGYRLPTRGEWETIQSYARLNNTSVANILSLPQNGAYQASRNTNDDVIINGRLSVNGAYWTSTYENSNPIVMHLGSTYGGYTTNATDYGYTNNGYQWTYTDSGLNLLASTTGELANIRCIKK